MSARGLFLKTDFRYLAGDDQAGRLNVEYLGSDGMLDSKKIAICITGNIKVPSTKIGGYWLTILTFPITTTSTISVQTLTALQTTSCLESVKLPILNLIGMSVPAYKTLKCWVKMKSPIKSCRKLISTIAHPIFGMG